MQAGLVYIAGTASKMMVSSALTPVGENNDARIKVTVEATTEHINAKNALCTLS